MIKRTGKNLHPRWRLLPPIHAVKVFISCLNGRNAPVKVPANEGNTVHIERQSIRVPSSKTDIVSFLQMGPSAGRRIVFVHGTPGNAKGWEDYLLKVPDGRIHIALDRLGYGSSRPTHAVVSLKRQAQAVAPLLRTEGRRKSILVGHSSGASVALQTALDFPEMVGGLLLLAGAFDPDLEEAIWFQPFGTIRPISRLLSRTINNANRELLGLKRELLSQADRLNQIRIPVGIVHGQMDPLVPLANLYYLQRKLKNARIHKMVLKYADHFIPWHSKPAIDAELERLINQVRKTER